MKTTRSCSPEQRILNLALSVVLQGSQGNCHRLASSRVPSSGGSCAPHPMSGTSVWVSGACSHLQMAAQSPQGHSRCRLGVRVSQGLCHPQSGTDKLSRGHPRWKRPLAHSWRPKTRNQPVPVTINYHVPVTQGHF